MTEVEERQYDPNEFEEEFEYEGEDPYYDEAEDRRNRLTEKPRKQPRGCGSANALANYNLSDVPPTAKLSLRRKSALDMIKSQIPQPIGCVPRTALPSWYELSMNEKIPLVTAPKNYIYYSRGKMGQGLYRCHPFYTVWDHRNLERVVGAPYTSLHDPHARDYLEKPAKKDFLVKQGLINESNEVLCSIKDFNKFRDYLRTQYNDQVHQLVSSGDQTLKSERKQLQRIKLFESDAEGHQAVLKSRRLKAIKTQREVSTAKSQKLEKKQRKSDLRMVEWYQEKSRQNLERIVNGYEKQRRIAERLYYVRFNRREAQRKLLKAVTLKDIEVAERIKSDQTMTLRAMERFKIEWIDSKLEYSKQRIEQNSQLESAIRNDIKSKARKRQRQVEHYRTQIPALVEKKKEAEKRLWEIVRKYAMRWLEKVRKRLNAPKDVQHESVWIGKSKGVLDDTLKYLKELSGYEKMDDFVLNIIKLKRQIQQQIELEEAQEAAEAEAAAKAAADGQTPEDKASDTNAEPKDEIPDAFKNAVLQSLEDNDPGLE